MKIQSNISLKEKHTFGIDVHANQYVAIDSVQTLQALLPLPDQYLILGSGSNILFSQDYPGLVIHNKIKGIDILEEDDQAALVQIGAGEIWHEVVLWALDNNLGGIENLSLIPGTVGAAPMQNIGAYGVELQDVFHSLQALHLQKNERHTFDKEACQFGYRDSIFKQSLKGQYCITSVILRLSKQHQYHIDYGAIQKVLEQDERPCSIQKISDAVIQIRQQKLPDPAQIGNAGSFFKNPVLPPPFVQQLKKQYPNMPTYPLPDNQTKVPAGWLIDQLGWKGHRKGDAGVHQNQALVLVNHGNASGQAILQLAQDIQQAVLETFGIVLSPEVNLI